MGETYDASIGGQKGLLHVGRGEGGDDGGGGAAAAVRFVSARDGSTPLSFDASRLLSCNAKGRQRMVVSYAEGDGDGGESEKRMATVRVLGTAADRVIGAVLELAEDAKERCAISPDGGAARAGADGATEARSTADAVAIAASSAGAPHGVPSAADAEPPSAELSENGGHESAEPKP